MLDEATHGCFILNRSPENGRLRIGFDPSRDEAYLMMSSSTWALTDRAQYFVMLQSGNEPPQKLPARNIYVEGEVLPFMKITLQPSDVAPIIGRGSMTISAQGDLGATIDWAPNEEAARALLACQRYDAAEQG